MGDDDGARAHRLHLLQDMGRDDDRLLRRHAGDQRAFDETLRVENGVVMFLLQTMPERRHFAPGRSLAQRLAPAPQSYRDDFPHRRMQARNLDKVFLDAPVDRRLRKKPLQIADNRQIVHDIAERGGFDQQNTHQRG